MMFRPEEWPHLLFLDIETATGKAHYDDYKDPLLKKHLERRADRDTFFKLDPEAPDYATYYHERAAIQPEFGRIVCITVGRLQHEDTGPQFTLQSYCGTDEAGLLAAFAEVLGHKNYFPKWAPRVPSVFPYPKIVGHNILGFDIPYLCKRYLLNRLRLPAALNVGGEKPWNLWHMADTLAYWKFTDFRGSAPLELLTALFGIPSPKTALGGEYVSDAYWKEGNHEQIAYYCEEDVLATFQVARALSQQEAFPQEKVNRQPVRQYH